MRSLFGVRRSELLLERPTWEVPPWPWLLATATRGWTAARDGPSGDRTWGLCASWLLEIEFVFSLFFRALLSISRPQMVVKVWACLVRKGLLLLICMKPGGFESHEQFWVKFTLKKRQVFLSILSCLCGCMCEACVVQTCAPYLCTFHCDKSPVHIRGASHLRLSTTAG